MIPGLVDTKASRDVESRTSPKPGLTTLAPPHPEDKLTSLAFEKKCIRSIHFLCYTLNY
jgi:hypothetical protein